MKYIQSLMHSRYTFLFRKLIFRIVYEKMVLRRKKMNRRTFFTKSFGCTAGLTLLAFPAIRTEILAAQGNKSKEEILKELEAKVDKFRPMYRTCSQASFAALNEQFGLKADQTIPALMPFAGGIAGKGETCGTVSGSLLAMGFFFESINQKGKKQAVSPIKYVGTFFDKLKKNLALQDVRKS